VQRSLIESEYQPIRGRGQPFWVCGRDRYQGPDLTLRIFAQPWAGSPGLGPCFV